MKSLEAFQARRQDFSSWASKLFKLGVKAFLAPMNKVIKEPHLWNIPNAK